MDTTDQVRTVAIDTRGETAGKPGKPSGEKKAKRTSPAVFYRQVVAELRKVIWPRRNDLVSYTTVVLVFVLIMVGIVFGIDSLLGKVVLAVFGGS
jgi:preprotein translocase subunit SecE